MDFKMPIKKDQKVLENKFKKINEEPDFIVLNKFDCSIKKLLEKYPDGVPDRLICQALLINETELDLIWKGIITKFKKRFKNN